MQKKILYKTLYFVILFNRYDLIRQGPLYYPWCKFLRKKRVLRTRFSMSVKRVNAGRFDAFRIRYAKHRQTISSSLRFALSSFRAAKRVFL